MTNKDKDSPSSTPIRNKLKSLRKMLGINYQEISEALDISAKEIERAENLKSSAPATTTSSKKYHIEIYDPAKSNASFRDLDLFDFDGINLLFEELKGTCDYIIEFCGHIKHGKELYDEFDNVSYEDNNVLEITSIKKVKNNL